jgi:uncharacterized repeat protein (TIGR03943 family)
VGALALQLGLTQGMLHFLRPGMRPYLVAAGAVLLVLGVTVAVIAWREDSRGSGGDASAGHDDHEHHRSLPVGWLLILPVVIGVLTPAALDAYSVARATPFQQRLYPLADFDVARFLKAQAIAGGVPELPLSDYIGAARGRSSNAEYLATHDVRVLGFVTPDDEGRPHRFLLTRFRIGCCAADAVPLQLDVLVPPDEHIPQENHWAEVTLRLVRPLPKNALTTQVRASHIEPVDKPDQPYDYM